MLSLLRSHPYVFAVLVALLTAGLSWMYARTIEKDPEVIKKTFNKTLAAALIAGLTLTYFVNRQERLSTEPFTADG